MKENTNEQKRKFNAMLLSTNREGMANVIDKQEEQGSCFLESTSFFKMIVPLVILFDSSTGFVEKNEAYITEAALYFDAKANSVFSLAYDGKEMRFLSDNKFDD